MSTDDATEKPANEEDARGRKAAADSLRRQIEILKKGRQPQTLNEFAERKAAEDRAKSNQRD